MFDLDYRCDFKNGYLRTIKEKDVVLLMSDLIDQDKEYARDAGYGEDHIQMIRDVMMNSMLGVSIVYKDDVFCSSFGLSKTLQEGVGCIWFLSCNNYFKCLNNKEAAFEFLINSKIVLEGFHEIFPILKCYVQSKNKDAKRRTKFMGFEPFEYGQTFTGYIKNGV